MKKIFSVLIAIVTLMTNTFFVKAEDDYTPIYIMAASSVTQTTEMLELLEYNSKVYIDSEKAALLSNTTITKLFNNIISFENGYFRVDYVDEIISYEGKLYCKLKELMNMLRTKYEYVSKSETLIFKHCTAFQENLYMECEKIIRENEPYDFEVNFLDNIYGVGLATVYNVMKGCRFDYIWGGYQQEQYEKAFVNIIKGPENESELLSLVSDGANIMSDFSTLLDLGETQGVYELFGLPYDDIIEIYNVYNEAIPGTGIKDATEIAQLVYTSQNAYETYANAVYYGVVKSKPDGILGDAADYIYSYYSGNAPTALSVYEEVINNYSTNKIEDLAKESLGIKSVYIKAAGLVLDALFGIDSKTSATEQAEICAEIQTIAFNNYNNGCHNYSKRYFDAQNTTPQLLNEAILQVKYSTILYLRACQYAFSNFKSEKGMESMIEFWEDATSEAIQTITAYEDADLIYVAENDDVKLEWCGTNKDEFVLLTNQNARELLESAVRCYVSCCCNQWFGIEYEEEFNQSGVLCQKTNSPYYHGEMYYYATDENGEYIMETINEDCFVLNYNSRKDIEDYIDSNLTDEANESAKAYLSEMFLYGAYYEYNDRLMRCPHCDMSGEKGSISYDLSSIEVLEKISDNEYLIAIDCYGSGDTYSDTDCMIIKNIDGVFKVSSIIYGEYQDKYYKHYIPDDYQLPDEDSVH